MHQHFCFSLGFFLFNLERRIKDIGHYGHAKSNFSIFFQVLVKAIVQEAQLTS